MDNCFLGSVNIHVMVRLCRESIFMNPCLVGKAMEKK